MESTNQMLGRIDQKPEAGIAPFESGEPGRRPTRVRSLVSLYSHDSDTSKEGRRRDALTETAESTELADTLAKLDVESNTETSRVAQEDIFDEVKLASADHESSHGKDIWPSRKH